jgi:hypothetical protein
LTPKIKEDFIMFTITSFNHPVNFNHSPRSNQRRDARTVIVPASEVAAKVAELIAAGHTVKVRDNTGKLVAM